MRKLLFVSTLVLLSVSTTSAFAGVCPASGLATDCNLLVTYNGWGFTSTVPVGGATPYDGSDGVMIGIVNDANWAISYVIIYGYSYGNNFGAFEFDGDGACLYITTPGVTCGHPPLGNYVSVWGDNGYNDQGSGVWFSNVMSLSPGTEDGGIVNFAGGLAPGATAWWSMESAVGSGPFYIGTPEPSTLILLSLGLLGFLRRRR